MANQSERKLKNSILKGVFIIINSDKILISIKPSKESNKQLSKDHQ